MPLALREISQRPRQGLSEKRRLLLWEAQKLAVEVEKFLTSLPGVSNATAVGSLRRKIETIGDLNFLVTGKSAAGVFTKLRVIWVRDAPAGWKQTVGPISDVVKCCRHTNLDGDQGLLRRAGRLML
jgi:hypothetical protein